MLNAITKGISKIFGTKSERDIKKLQPYVDQINEEYKKLASLSNDELRGKTKELRNTIDERLKSYNDEIEALQKKVRENPEMDIYQKEETFNQIDKIKENRNQVLEDVLMEILPQGFAVVKETARRFKENEQLSVTPTDQDKKLAAERSNVEIKGEEAVWYNSWVAADNKVTWDMIHFDVQLLGGVVLHEGKIAEMATGEGKTLVSTLPAYLNGLAGKGVHIITVNEYLARRDSEWMGPLLEFHGLTVGCIDNHDPHSEGRRQAYHSDVTYGTNNEFGFDYLRDNMSHDPEELVQRELHFGIVDEVDSVLIDDARTPLIISGPVPKGGEEKEYEELNPKVAKLVEAQRKLVSDLLVEAKKKIKEGNEKEGGLPLFRAHRGLPKHKPLIKFLSEQGVRTIMNQTENYYLQDNAKELPKADEVLYFTIDEKNNQVELTDKGIEMMGGEDGSDMYTLPDIGSEMADIENDTSLSNEEKSQKKEELMNDFAEKSKRIHAINQLLKAYTLFEKDVDYILADNQVKIVDEQTGRVMEGRRYSDGLHQALEAKEQVKIEEASQTYASISLQNYFRMYHKLSGMTGTAETEAGEFWEIYSLDVVVIPTHEPCIRDDREDLVYKTTREKFNAVVEEIEKMRQQGRPILVGTTSVENSEIVSRMLKLRNIDHQVLNAKHHQKEAEIIAEAGKPGTVTIATNMAGRGTDIKLDQKSREAGGLTIVGTERHESRRIDRQLRGRAGRQGDPGSSQFFVSLEDNLMRLFGSERISKLMDRMGLPEGEVIRHSWITNSIEKAQKKVEENSFHQRKNLLDYDDAMNSQRKVVYTRRRNALFGDRLQLDIMNMIYDVAESIVQANHETEDYNNFKLDILSTFSYETDISAEDFRSYSSQELTETLYNEAYNKYKEKNEELVNSTYPLIKNVYDERGATVENIVVPFTEGQRNIAVTANLEDSIQSGGWKLIRNMEKYANLAIIDEAWKNHLREMDDLRQSVQNAVYEQKDPKLIYKFEAFELFKKFISKLNHDAVNFLFKAEIPLEEEQDVKEARQERRKQQYQENKESVGSPLQNGGESASAQGSAPQQQPARTKKVAGRNDRVTVQYNDGNIRKGVKYKAIEEDLKNNKCVLIDD